jgi:hypothetical protein
LAKGSFVSPAIGWRGDTTDDIDGFTFTSAATSAPINFSRLINYLVGTGEDCRRDSKAERSRGIEIDGQPEFTGRLDRQIGGMRALEDLVDVTRRAAEQVAVIGARCTD